MVVLVAVAACDARPPRPVAAVRDSAGTTIVTNDGTDRALAWTVRPLYALGGKDDGPEAFYQVNAGLVAVDDENNVTVVDPMAARVHQFAADGSHRWSFGNRGSGPGELEYPVRVGASPAGELAIVDARRNAVLAVDPSGRFLGERRAAPFTIQVVPAAGGEVTEQWKYGEDGRVALLKWVGGADTVAIVRAAPVRTSKAQFEGCGPSPATVGPIMLAPELAWYARDSIVAVTATARYEVDIYDVGGRLQRSVRRMLPARAATAADAERWAEQNPITYTRGSTECRIPAREMVEKIGYADSLPTASALVLAPDGGLWVRRWSVTGRDGPIDVFDSAGTYVGTLPATFPFPLHVRADGRLLYGERDERDVERLVVGEVVRDGSR
jgi:hypothetical protein